MKLTKFYATSRRLKNGVNGNPRYCLNIWGLGDDGMLYPYYEAPAGVKMGKYSSVEQGFIHSTYTLASDMLKIQEALR